jgi:hypothetical protein
MSLFTTNLSKLVGRYCVGTNAIVTHCAAAAHCAAASSTQTHLINPQHRGSSCLYSIKIHATAIPSLIIAGVAGVQIAAKAGAQKGAATTHSSIIVVHYFLRFGSHRLKCTVCGGLLA